MDNPWSITSITIRRATKEDIGLVRVIDISANNRWMGIPGLEALVTAITLPTEAVREMIDSGRIYLAIDDVRKTAVGFVAACEQDSLLFIDCISVKHTFQAQGVGSKLMEKVFEWARQSGLGKVGLTTFADVRWNAPWYRKLGFKEVEPEILGKTYVDCQKEDRDEWEAISAGWRRCCMLWEDSAQ